MPARPRQHELETESREAFERSLGSRFVYRRQEPDYGLDGDVEEFGQDRSATGVRYYVQLKATDETDLAKALSLRLDRDHLDYYRSLALPVLMVRYHAPTGRLFVRWVHAYSGPEPAADQQSLLFRWSDSDEWTDNSPANKAREARAFVELRQASLRLPIPFVLDSSAVSELTAPEVRIALEYAARRCADLIELGTAKEPIGRIFARNEFVGAHLTGVSGATFTPPFNYDPGPTGEKLAADVFVSAALAFWRVGQADVASRLAATFLPEAEAMLSPDVVLSFMTAMLQARRVLEALETWEKLDARAEEHSRAGASFFAFVASRFSRTLSREEANAFVATSRRCIQRRLEEGKPEEAGALSYNLGLHHSARAEPHDGVQCYEEAAELDARYRDRAYYWRELAGILFITRRHEESAGAYDRAVELGAGGFVLALRADAHLFAGQYECARVMFDEFLSSWTMPQPGAEFALKVRVIDEINARLGLTDQRRDPDAAGEIAGRLAEATNVGPADAAVLCEDALRRDALSPLPWFNLGRCDLDRGNRRGAGFDYLAAALLREDDPEAWVNAFVLLWEAGEMDVLPLILVTADRFTQGRFMLRLATFAKEQGSDFPRTGFLEAVNAMAARLPRHEPSTVNAIRLIDDEGRAQLLPLTDHLEDVRHVSPPRVGLRAQSSA